MGRHKIEKYDDVISTLATNPTEAWQRTWKREWEETTRYIRENFNGLDKIKIVLEHK